MRMDSLGGFTRVARWVALASVVAACGDESGPADDGGDGDTYHPCTEALCTAGSTLCCYLDSRPGTWDPVHLGCICPSNPDADADGDGDADADADIGPEVDGDVDLDVEADVEPDVGPDTDDVTDEGMPE